MFNKSILKIKNIKKYNNPDLSPAYKIIINEKTIVLMIRNF